MNEKQYDNMVNEGGEGYNPIREKRIAAEYAEQSKPKTIHEQIDRLERKLELEDSISMRECSLYDQGKVDALNAELISLINATGWDLGTTKARRSEWNARVKAGEFTKGKSVDMAKMKAAETAQGWTMAGLKQAIAWHKL